MELLFNIGANGEFHNPSGSISDSFSNSVIGDTKSEYIPLYSIKPLNTDRNLYPKYFQGVKTSAFESWLSKTPIPLQTLVMTKLQIVNQSTLGISNLEELKYFSQTLEKLLLDKIENIHKENVEVHIPSFRRSIHDYTTLKYYFIGSDNASNRLVTFSTSAQRLFIGRGVVMAPSSVGIGLPRPLAVMAIRREYLDYFMMCSLMGEKPDHRIFKVFEDPTLDIKDTPYRLFRPYYRKFFKRPLQAQDVEFELSSTIYSNFYRGMEIPKEVSSIKAKKEWVTNSIEEVCLHEQIVENLAGLNVDLEI